MNCLQEDFVEEEETDQWNGWQAMSQILFQIPASILVIFAVGLSVNTGLVMGRRRGVGSRLEADESHQLFSVAGHFPGMLQPVRFPPVAAAICSHGPSL